MRGTLKACGKDPKYPETGKFNITIEHGGNSDGLFRMMKRELDLPEHFVYSFLHGHN